MKRMILTLTLVALLPALFVFAQAQDNDDEEKMVWVSDDGGETEVIVEIIGGGRGMMECGEGNMMMFGGGMGRHGGKGMCDNKGGHRAGGGIRHLLAMADKIGLTDKQTSKLKNMMLNHQEEKIDNEATLKKARLRMKAMMHDDDASERVVMSSIDKVTSAMSAQMKMRYTHKQAVHSVLTKEQMEKMKSAHKGMGRMGAMGMGDGKGMFFNKGGNKKMKMFRVGGHGSGHGGL